MRLLSGFKRFTELAALSLYFGARPGYQRVHELVDALANRIQAYALVGGSLVPLSPPSRRDGGFGVVASVSGNAVTLAAGSTLTSGRMRLWDKSAGVYLDAGGVEGRVSGLTVYLADTTGLAAGDVIHADRLEVTSYAAAVALETALGTSHNGEIRVVNRTSGAVILRRVVRSGAWTSVEVDFAAVTATPNGAAASVAGAVVTVTAPHTLATAAQILRVQIVTDGTWLDVASGQWSVSGNDVTVPAATAAAIAAALGAAKAVRMHVEGVSELCIGGSSCYLRPGPGAWGIYTGTAQIVYTETTGYAYAIWGKVLAAIDDYAADIVCTIDRSAAADGQYAYAGLYVSATKHLAGGTLRAGGADVTGGSSGAIASPTLPTVEAAGGSWPMVRVGVRSLLSVGTSYNSASVYPAARRVYLTASFAAPPTAYCCLVHSAAGERVGLSCTRCVSL